MIEGTLVRLRAYDMADLDHLCDWFNDRDVTRYLSMRYPIARAFEEPWLRERVSAAPSDQNVWFVIETKDGVHIGGINFHIVIRESRKARLGIAIGDQQYWSRGYGTDAMLTMLRFGFDEMNLHRIDLTVDADNDRGIACYRKCGFVEEGRLRRARYRRGEYVDQIVMGVLREEFAARRQ